MKKIIGILLIGFLGFLGCSDSDDTTRTVGQATPVSPFGIIETPSPTYEWTPVRWATKYRLVVQDTNQSSTVQDSNETSIIDEWYAPEEADCTSEENLCMVTPEIEVIGENEFKILACVNEECGLWSDTLTFDFTALNGPRFTDNGDNTVTDNNTKLMWSKNANLTGSLDWQNAMSYCANLILAKYSDWRLPSISEFNCLIDKEQKYPALTLDNPFMNVQNNYYWSSTTKEYEYQPRAWYVDLFDGQIHYDNKEYPRYVWPVRSGS